MKKSFSFTMTLLCLLVLYSSSALAEAHLSFNGKQIILHRDGGQTLLSTDDYPPMRVKDSQGNELSNPAIWYCGVGSEEEEGKTPIGVAPGLYFFAEEGPQTGFIPNEEAGFCFDVRLSPGKKVMAVDTGTWVIRFWSFYTYPDFKELGQVSYLDTDDSNTLIWTGDTGSLISSIDDGGGKRSCEYDPCGPVSVTYYDFATQKSTPVFAGTDLCNYKLAGYNTETNEVEAEQLCLKSLQDWKLYPENAPTERVFKKLTTASQQ